MSAAAWQDHPFRQCQDQDPELFFPVGHGPRAIRQTAEAKAVCAGCPVIEQCLRYALDTYQEGVWGGTTDDERKALRKVA